MDPLLTPVQVPNFPRADEFAGPWAIEPAAAAALWDLAQKTDLAAHMAAPAVQVQSTMERIPAPDGKSSVALVRLQGLLMKQQSSLGTSTSTIQARRDIRAAASDPNISAILVAVDSPGGSAAGAEALSNDIRDAAQAKPVYAQIDDMGASAAYYAIAGAQKIFASRKSTQAGSIGTLLTVVDQSAAAEKQGVKVHVFATGPVKGAGVPGTPVNELHQANFQKYVQDIQAPFDAAVKSGRRLNDQQLAAVKTGGVFTAEEAMSLGLVDGIQSIETTLSQLTSAGARPAGKPSPYSAGGQAAGHGAIPMNEFEQFCADRGVDPGKVTEAQLANLQFDFDASKKPAAPIAKPVTIKGGDGASLMGDIEAFNANALRVAEIQAVCHELGNPKVEYNGVTQTAYQHAVKHGFGVDDARRLCQLGVLRNSKPVHAGVAVGPTGAQRDEIVQCALEQTLGLKNVEQQYSEQVLQSAHSIYRGRMGLKRMLLEAAALGGYQSHIDSIDHDLKGVLQAAFSSVQLTGILGNTANKMLLQSFLNTEQTWRVISKIRPVKDFKTVTSYRMTGDGQFIKVGPGGDLKDSGYTEESFTNAADTYGIKCSITRRDIINDDLGAFSDQTKRLGRGGGLKLNDVFWTAFTTNSTFFVDPSQDYYKGADSVLAAAGLAKVLAKFRTKTDADGKVLSIEPKILLVPAALEVTALELMQSTNYNTGGSSSTDKVPNKNIWAAKFAPAVSAYLDNASYGNSVLNWYLLADPEDIPVIETVFLNGNETPIIETADADFGTLGIAMRGYFDFGATKQDSRGGVKSKGAA